MNERDKELAEQAGVGDTWNKADWYSISPEMLKKFANIIRVDERAALEKIDWTAIMREGCLVTWADAQELGDRVLAAIRARGNT